jgi:hypothetical protein
MEELHVLHASHLSLSSTLHMPTQHVRWDMTFRPAMEFARVTAERMKLRASGSGIASMWYNAMGGACAITALHG